MRLRITIYIIISIAIIIIIVNIVSEYEHIRISQSSIDVLKKYNTKVVFSALNEEGKYRGYISESTHNYRELKTPFSNNFITPSFSPDGNIVIYAEFDGHGYQLAFTDISQNKTERLTNNKYNDYAPVFSPDGKYIAWCRVPKMELQEADQAKIFISTWPDFHEKQLTANELMDAYPVFTPDNKNIIVERGRVGNLFGLFQIDLQGKDFPLLYDPQRSGNGIPHVYNNQVVFERVEVEAPGQLGVFLMDLPSRQIRRLCPNTPCNPTPRFSPDGTRIAYHNVDQLKLLGRVLSEETYIVILGRNSSWSPITCLRSTSKKLILPRWNHDGRVIVGYDFANDQLKVFDLKGDNALVSAPGKIRNQKFMEIYNYDIY